MTKLKIKVTKEILIKSMGCGHTSLPITKNCAVALAIRDIFPEAEVCEDASIFLGVKCQRNRLTISPFGSDHGLEIELPQEAETFIRKFDCTPYEERPKMDELEFEVEIPDRVLEFIDIQEIRQVLKTSSNLELV